MNKIIWLSLFLCSLSLNSMEHKYKETEVFDVDEITIDIPREEIAERIFDNQQLSEKIVNNYFLLDQAFAKHFMPYLVKRIKKEADSPTADRIDKAHSLKRVFSHSKDLDKNDIEYIHKLTLEAVREFTQDHLKLLEIINMEAKNKISKNKAACYASLSALVSTLVTAAVALTIHFTS